MVEGHQCHRTGHNHKKLLGQRFKATSPNARFTDGAKALDMQPLSRIEVHGKNMFYFFGTGPKTVVLRVHFGMSGAFKTLARDKVEEWMTKPTTRLLLVNDKWVCMVSAMIVEFGGLEFYEEQIAKLGPDPLREDADRELLWASMQKAKTPVGLVLMQQDKVAGIGNIYRAEILFKAGVHPELPARAVQREAFERIWRHSVALLQRGFKQGSILTVDPEEAAALGDPKLRRYIYNKATCARCKTPVRVWDMAARTCYACEACQPPPDLALLAPPRAKALGGAKANKKVFKSHCAPEAAAALGPAQLTVAELRARLQALSQPTKGLKADLVQRLTAALDTAVPGSAAEGPAGEERAAAKGSAAAPKEEGGADVAPGTAGLGHIATAEEAALEKARAGEGRDVEHVALETEGTLALAAEGVTSRPGARRRAPKRGGAAPGTEAASTGAKEEAAAPAEEPTAPAGAGKLRLRQRKSAARAAPAAARRVRSKSSGLEGKGAVVGLDTPYQW